MPDDLIIDSFDYTALGIFDARLLGYRSTTGTVLPETVSQAGRRYVLSIKSGKTVMPVSKPANKPHDPAFENALRVRPVRIGLRYLGD